MCLFGIGFGIGQNATFAMIDRAPVSGCNAASALWNLAYDADTSNPAVFGVFVAHRLPGGLCPHRDADARRAGPSHP
jgi:hypothetical protein